MPHWLIKSALQRAISWLPASHRWNELFQKRVTRSLDLTRERFDMRLTYCRRHLDNYLAIYPEKSQNFTVLELGTGWYPVVPIGLFLSGASELHTYDISPLLTTPRLKAVLQRFVDYDANGRLRTMLPQARVDRVQRLREVCEDTKNQEPSQLLASLKIHCHVQDAQETGLPAGTTDLAVSTGVLEYIPPPILRGILNEFARVSSSASAQSHYINLVDQFWYFDKSITPFNYLRYSERAWKFLNSPMTWQNRFRISDYRKVFADAGYEILNEETSSGNPEDLKRVKLSKQFESYAEPDLLVLYAWLVAKPKTCSQAAVSRRAST